MLKIFAIGTLVTVMMTAVASKADAAPAETKDIVDTAVAAGSFKTLAKALTAADLIGTLKGKGPFTVFAPTDEAFAKLPAGNTGVAAQAREQGEAAADSHVPRRGRQGDGGGRREDALGQGRERRHDHDRHARRHRDR